MGSEPVIGFDGYPDRTAGADGERRDSGRSGGKGRTRGSTAMSSITRLAKAPFEIYTLAHVSRMEGPTASTLRELAEGLSSCSEESIYHHTIVAMRNHLVLADEMTNDFAQWTRTSLGFADLADRLSM